MKTNYLKPLASILLIMFLGISSQSLFGQIRLGPALGTSLAFFGDIPVQFYSAGVSLQVKKHSISLYYEKVNHPFFSGLSPRSPYGVRLSSRYKIANLTPKLAFFVQTSWQYFSIYNMFLHRKFSKNATTGILEDVYSVNMGIGLERKMVGDLYLSLMIGGGVFYVFDYYFATNRWDNSPGVNYAVQLSARYLFTLKE